LPISYSLLEHSELFKQVSQKGFSYDGAVKQFQKALSKYCTSSQCRETIKDRGTPSPVLFSESRTRSFGTADGIYFEYKVAAGATKQLKKIYGKASDYVYRCQLEFGDGANSEVIPAVGGVSGTKSEWNVPEGQYITQV
jgi:hypothetical protein